jgi:beta-galactosidase
VVSYFRWRQAPFAQEQMHAGLNLPDNSGLSPGGREAARVGAELAAMGALPATARARVALVFDYEASWITRIQPQGADFSYLELTFRWYEAVRRLGLDLDILAAGADLAGYPLVLVPTLPHVGEAAAAAFARAEGYVLFGPRSGSKTRHFAIPDNLPPGPLASLVPVRVIEVASLRPGLRNEVSGSPTGAGERWRERIEATGVIEIDARFEDGDPALVRAGRWSYLACWPDATLLANVMLGMAAQAGLPVEPLPEGVRLRRRGHLTFAFNYGDAVYRTPPSATQFVLGGAEVGPSEVAIWRT